MNIKKFFATIFVGCTKLLGCSSAAFFWSIDKNHTTIASRFLDFPSGIDLNQIRETRYLVLRTPLMLAITRGKEKIAKRLLEQPNIDIFIETTHDRTALSCAAECGYVEIVRKILQIKESQNRWWYHYTRHATSVAMAQNRQERPDPKNCTEAVTKLCENREQCIRLIEEDIRQWDARIEAAEQERRRQMREVAQRRFEQERARELQENNRILQELGRRVQVNERRAQELERRVQEIASTVRYEAEEQISLMDESQELLPLPAPTGLSFQKRLDAIGMDETNPRFYELFENFIDIISKIEVINDPVKFSSDLIYDRARMWNWAKASREGNYFPDPKTRKNLHINELNRCTHRATNDQIEALVSAEEAAFRKKNLRIVPSQSWSLPGPNRFFPVVPKKKKIHKKHGRRLAGMACR